MLKRISRTFIVSLLSISVVLTSIMPVFADDLISDDDILSVQEEAVVDYDFSDEVVEEDISDVQSDSVTEISEEDDLIVDTSEESLINDDIEILTTEEAWDGITTEKIYEQDDIKFVFTITSSWRGGYNAKVEIYNNRSEIIDNWAIDMVFSGEITNIWNATIENRNDRTYTIKNAAWNADIKSGHSVSFGFTGKGDFGGFPESFNTLGLIVEKSDEEYDVQYYLDSDWGSGFTGRIVITNNSDETIEDWILSFTFDREITSIWNASIESHEGNRYVIKNMSYNADILPGESISFGFNGKKGYTSDNPWEYKLESVSYNSLPGSNIEINSIPDEERNKEKLDDIGENYFKQPSSEDIVFDDESGIKYVRNQLLISAYMGTPKEAMEEIAEELGAEIVGYTAITCDYQFEFNGNLTMDDLDEIAEYLQGYPYISNVFLNTVIETSWDATTNDYFYNDTFKCEKKYCDVNGDGDTNDDEDFHYVTLSQPANGMVVDDWNENSPMGENWGLEAMHVPSAWDLVVDSQAVKVGIIDSYFEDVITPTGKRELEFDDILRNRVFDAKNHSLAHGDHVAGIIGAKHNNGFGISGVATDVRLYGYTMSESELDATGGVSINCMAGVKVALSTLICNHVKIINMSLGYGDETLVYGASQGNVKAINQITKDAAIATEHLKKLLNAGYDFLIVKSAGNYNGHKFVTDNSNYGYHVYNPSSDANAAVENKEVLAEYGYFINAISDKNVKDHIIVVGSFGESYNLSTFSGRGSRVDVVAPGENILSTAPRSLDLSAAPTSPMPIPGFKIMQGTSMATPYISGVAALMFQVKPSLSTKKVKEFICSSSYASRQIRGYNVPDAGLCVEKAKNILDTTSFDNDWPTGLAAGSIRDSSGNKIFNASFHIQAIRHSTGDYNLDRYAFDFEADGNGDFLYPLPQGVYDFLIYIDNSSNKYLPIVIQDVEILPDQTNYMETIRLAIWTSRTSGNVKGIINNAITGAPLAGVTARIRKGWNATTGAYVTNLSGRAAKEATSSLDGTFSISAAIGTYTLELKKAGFITAYYNVLATQGNAILNGYDVSMSMTPVLPDDEYRIVLTWGSAPADLDSHLTYYQDGAMKFHVYYRNKSAYINGEKVAWLDLDDTNSYGPETVTITVKGDLLEKGELRYSVHNFSGGLTGLSNSNASVRIYKGNELKKTYSVSQNQQALVWHVFTIDKEGIKLNYTYDNLIN